MRVLSACVAALVLVGTWVRLDARPNRYGHSDREERHMFPAVSSGPLDPAWSPDGKWIAFTMRGDIWKVPAEGGPAVALTAGPAYHFEPAWSPDGRRIAFSYESTGNLEIGIISADGGPEETVASNPAVDLEPVWSRDGQSLYFASARAGGWQIFRHDLAANTDASIVRGIQPAVSPDGHSLAYAQGGVRVLDLASGQSRVVRAEETEYRTKPVWTPDGKNLVYVTEDKGSNDIRIISATGGDPVELTFDPDHHEMSPAVSPDGTRIAFVQFDAAVPTLYTMGIAGGRASTWTKVAITSRKSVRPTGRVRIRVVDAAGRPMPGRIYIDASDGRHYTPDGLFERSMMVFDRHYFHLTQEAEVELPAGPAKIEALCGFEYVPHAVTVDVAPDAVRTATIVLNRLVDLPAQGWYSGDSHLHDLHQGFGLTHEAFFRQLVAEDINVTHALIHMDGTRLMGRWADLTGQPSPLSTPTHILEYAEEFRGNLGHIGMIGIHEFVLPLIAGEPGTAYTQPTLDTPYFEGAHAQGGLAGFMHPYTAAPRTPAAASATLIALDVGLGLGDYYDIGALYSDERGSADFYDRLLNAGAHLPATGGTDNFSDVWLDPPPGTDRTFAHVTGPLSLASWMDAVKHEHTVFSNGPILMLDVGGRQPGDAIDLPAAAPATLHVHADARAIAPLDAVEILVNGEVVQTVTATDRLHITFDGPVNVPAGGWVAARTSGPASVYLGDDYAFAQTSPVYVVRGGHPYYKAADVQFLADTVEAIWARVQNAPWRSAAERSAFEAAVIRARAFYRERLAAAQ